MNRKRPSSAKHGTYSVNQRILAGSKKYGMWSTEVEKFENLSFMVHKWCRELRKNVGKHHELCLIDAGSGNATNSYPIALELARGGKQVHIYLVDIQEDANVAAKTILAKVSIPQNLHFILEKQNLETMNLSQPVHGIYCHFVLHLLSPNNMKKTLIRFHKALFQGGLLIISVPSIYDAKNIEPVNGNIAIRDELQLRLTQVLQQTQKGKSTQIMKGRGGFPRKMYFFTEPALSALLIKAGFRIKDLAWEINNDHPNGLSKDYPETLTVIAEK